jgi:hypothetical protein
MNCFKFEKGKTKDIAVKFNNLLQELPDGKYELEIRKPKRTNRQNNAIHLYFEMIADTLNEYHLYCNKEFFKDSWEIEWRPEMVKELMWKPVQKILTGKLKTSELNTTEVQRIVEVFERNFAEKGISVVFPSQETLFEQNEIL